MSANELRQAAVTLRLAAREATAMPWSADDVVMWMCDGGMIMPQDRLDAYYIATVHPGVGLELADWLDYVSDRAKARTGRNYQHAAKLARLINGGAA